MNEYQVIALLILVLGILAFIAQGRGGLTGGD